MKHSAHGSKSILSKLGKHFTRFGRLAGLIQVCRPNWQAESSWHAAEVLSERGLKDMDAFSELKHYLAYLDGELTTYAQHYMGSRMVAVASENELRKWASRWNHYRAMAHVDIEAQAA